MTALGFLQSLTHFTSTYSVPGTVLGFKPHLTLLLGLLVFPASFSLQVWGTHSPYLSLNVGTPRVPSGPLLFPSARSALVETTTHVLTAPRPTALPARRLYLDAFQGLRTEILE